MGDGVSWLAVGDGENPSSSSPSPFSVLTCNYIVLKWLADSP